jgi:hypothetical protein
MKQMPVTAGNFNVWRNQAQSFEDVAAFQTTASVITGGAEPGANLWRALSATICCRCLATSH